ncbi:MAG: LD-carboxypeptidase [Taibaiella sp.]|nr:LD-carboxypeptidase [Taibaiella sp.]
MLPPYLKQGSLIGITCPAGYVSEERTTHAIKVLEEWGFRVRKGKTVGNEFHYFSGTDNERLDDLQEMMDDPEIDAIIMGRGGYGMSRIIDDLNFRGFKKHPKWICGFSDITVLHSHLLRHTGCASLHSPMCGAFKPETDTSDHILAFRAALTGMALPIQTETSIYNRQGEAKGILTGGNLAILAHLTGSASEVDTDGKILFIEDIGEHLYNADRLLLNLKRAGKLENLAALVVGGFTDMQDTERPFGQTIEQIIADKVADYSYPVCFDLPVGHQEVNYTLVLGTEYTLSVTGKGGTLKIA